MTMIDSIAAQLNSQVVSADASGKILTWDTRTGGVVDSYILEDPIHISHIQVRGHRLSMCISRRCDETAKAWMAWWRM